MPHSSRALCGLSGDFRSYFRCHPDESESSRKDPTTVSSEHAGWEIYFTAGSIGVPVHCTRAKRQRKVPQAGFAAFQDDIKCRNYS